MLNPATNTHHHNKNLWVCNILKYVDGFFVRGKESKHKGKNYLKKTLKVNEKKKKANRLKYSMVLIYVFRLRCWNFLFHFFFLFIWFFTKKKKFKPSLKKKIIWKMINQGKKRNDKDSLRVNSHVLFYLG